MYIDIATAQQPKRQKKNKKRTFFFKKKRMNCVMFMGTAFKRLKLELFFWMSKGIFMAQSYPTQYVLFNIWVT